MILTRPHLHSSESESVLDILGHAERNPLGHSQALALLKADVVVDVHHLARGELNQQVVEVTVPETDDVTDHAHDRRGAAVGLSGGPPFRGTRGSTPQLPGKTQERGGEGKEGEGKVYIYKTEKTFKNEQRSKDATAKKRLNTSGVGKMNNYY